MANAGAVARLLARRAVTLVGVLLALSIIAFALIHLAEGDIVRNLIGNRKATPETVAAIRAKYNLDLPVWRQYLAWLVGVVQGDWGTSVRTGAPVGDMIAARLPLTAGLIGLAAVLACGIGVPLGVMAAKREGRALDRAIVTGSVVGVSSPPVAVALVLIYVFGVALGVMPMYGAGRGGWDTLRHLVLPAAALAIGVGASIVKITRTAVLGELAGDYVVFARARSLPERAINRSILSGAAPPIWTSAGLVVAGLVGGSVLVETTFALPGMGVLLTDSIHFKDVPVVQAVTLLVATAIAATTFLVDAIVVLTDPRHSLAEP
ncbi:MAG: ABC transporter permease [Bifidobacteriaceae bacterium]|jgi:peptide/nickel transport system permease protein|nr:ABC transporter permease [Bifidobacteriaceae bacterium]